MTASDKIKDALNQQGIQIPWYLMETLTDRITNAFPPEIINNDFEYFLKVTERDEKGEKLPENRATIELSILTLSNVILDLVISVEKSETVVLAINANTRIHLTVFDAPLDESAFMKGVAYRAELVITNGVTAVEYTAEGNRRLVQTLITYGEKCLHALHRAKS